MLIPTKKSFRYALISALCVAIGLSEASALIVTHESFVSTEAYKIEFIGDNAGAQFGAAIAGGDINGDGFDDLIVGSPFASSDSKSWNGKMSVILGRSRAAGKSIDLANDSYVATFSGEGSGDQLGSSVAAGDFNADGYDDIAVGAYNASDKGKRTGKLYIFYGGSHIDSQTENLGLGEPDLELAGSGRNDEFGLGLEVVDINADNYADILIGAPSADAVSTNSGVVYAHFGGGHGLSSGVDAVYYGQNSNERFGSKIGAGKFDSENYKVAVGAYKASAANLIQAGKVYIFDALEGGQPEMEIQGEFGQQWFGFDLEADDLNNDGKDDLVISSFPYELQQNIGRVSVFWGGERFSAGENLIDNKIDRNFVINGGDQEAYLGASVLIGDFNNDNYSEIAAGAPGIAYSSSKEAGDTYVVYGSANGYDEEYVINKEKVDVTVHGERADDWFGFSLADLDFNRDGYRDLAIGSRYSDIENGVNNGKVFLMLGEREYFGERKEIVEATDETINRGELVRRIMGDLGTAEEKADEIEDCYAHAEFCLFNFMATSLYDEIVVEDGEVVLYPDVKPEDDYYEEITEATMLGLVNGYMNEDESPFYPERKVSRIQALKVILSATDLVEPSYRFQLVAKLGSEFGLKLQKSYFADVDPRIEYMWWYPRYVNFAVENGIIEDSTFFRPDQEITIGELEEMIESTLKFLSNEEAKSSTDPRDETLSDSGEEEKA